MSGQKHVLIVGGVPDPGVPDAENSYGIQYAETARLVELAEDAGLIIAADRGAAPLLAVGLEPHIVIGDMDSIGSLLNLLPERVEVVRAPRDKDETDLELALLAAAQIAPAEIEIWISHALGGRMDHSLANLQLAARPELAGRRLRFLAGDQTLWPILGPSRLEIEGGAGDTVSLLPLGEGVHISSTQGLHWPLADAALPLGPARGVSNRMTADRAAIELAAGFLLCVHIPAASRML